MAHVSADRVRDTSTSTGTGAFVVSGTAPTAFRTFSAVLSTNDTFYYAIQHQTANEWEVGLGTYSSANTITRTTVYASSASGSAVTFSAGTKDVFITLAATRTIQYDGSSNVGIGTSSPASRLQVYDATNAAIQLTGDAVAGYVVERYSTNASGPYFFTRKGRGTYASQAAVTTGDVAGEYLFGVWGGTTNRTIARIRSTVEAYTSDSDIAGNLSFYTSPSGAAAGTEKVRINGAGDFAIGTTAPSTRLDVAASNPTRGLIARLQNPSVSGQTGSQLWFNQSGIANWVIGQPASTDAFAIWSSRTDVADGTERMRITSAGNVAIGTTSAASKMYITTSSSTAYGLISQTPTVGLTTGNYVNMAYFANSRSTNNDGLRIVNVRDSTGSGVGNWETESFRIRRSVDQNDGSSGVQEEIVFGANLLAFNTAGSERMRIDSSGNVGVGTTSPTAKITAYSGGTNATTYNTMIAAGGGSTATIQNQGTTSVSTTATTILTSGQYGSFCLVFGSDGTNRFMDVVLFGLGTGNVNVISSLNVAGSPSARTYSQSSSIYKLAMASGTYTVQVAAFSMSG